MLFQRRRRINDGVRTEARIVEMVSTERHPDGRDPEMRFRLAVHGLDGAEHVVEHTCIVPRQQLPQPGDMLAVEVHADDHNQLQVLFDEAPDSRRASR